MTPEERELLKETAELVKENHKILKSMRRSARFASFMRLVYWVIIIGSAFFTYYTIKPYIVPLVNSYNSLKENIESIKNTTSKLPALPAWMGGEQ
jgi:hypothetical protein